MKEILLRALQIFGIILCFTMKIVGTIGIFAVLALILIAVAGLLIMAIALGWEQAWASTRVPLAAFFAMFIGLSFLQAIANLSLEKL